MDQKEWALGRNDQVFVMLSFVLTNDSETSGLYLAATIRISSKVDGMTLGLCHCNKSDKWKLGFRRLRFWFRRFLCFQGLILKVSLVLYKEKKETFLRTRTKLDFVLKASSCHLSLKEKKNLVFLVRIILPTWLYLGNTFFCSILLWTFSNTYKSGKNAIFNLVCRASSLNSCPSWPVPSVSLS